MKKVKKYLITIISMLFAFFIVDNDGVGALQDFVVINADVNGAPTNVHFVEVSVDGQTGGAETEAKQFTRTRDITLTVNAPSTILNKYEDFIVCDVIIISDDQKKIDSDNCPKYSLSQNVHNYQLQLENDGEKEIAIIFNYLGKNNWNSLEDDIIVKKIVLDTTGPVIDLEGGEYVYIPLGKNYSELGASCEDDSIVKVEGGCKVVIEDKSIDMNKSGFQYIRYTAIDALGNETNILRKVMVEIKEDERGMDLYWYFAIGALVITIMSVSYIVIKNKEKQRNQSVL